MGRAETEAIMTEAMVAKFIIIQVTLGFILNGLTKTPLGLLPETKEVNMSHHTKSHIYLQQAKLKDLIISLIVKTIF